MEVKDDSVMEPPPPENPAESKPKAKRKKKRKSRSEKSLKPLPELLPVPDVLPPEQSARLDEVCQILYNSKRLDSISESVRDKIKQKLTELVRDVYPNANLQIYGSSKNGFGTRNCDLDMSLTFEDDETGQGLHKKTVINRLSRTFRGNPNIPTVQAITRARVPILKLSFKLGRENPVDCDISPYNIAIYNTKLLRSYCDIDERVPMLGLVVKQFFKTCGICDASRGSLSSYAYTLMTLYYLQRCDPPVIPVLQELYDGDSPPKHIVDGHNTWFFSDLDRLSEKWPYRRANKMSLGDLFYGFMKFYAETFSFDTLVVSIRTSKDLTKAEKKWTDKSIAIEDPFVLSHCLGKTSRDMARFIQASIVLGRNRIGSQPDNLQDYKDWIQYFLDTKYLLDGPFIATCSHCGKEGHSRRKCPDIVKDKGKGSKKLKLRKRSPKEMKLDAGPQNPNQPTDERHYRRFQRPDTNSSHNRSHHEKSPIPSVNNPSQFKPRFPKSVSSSSQSSPMPHKPDTRTPKLTTKDRSVGSPRASTSRSKSIVPSSDRRTDESGGSSSKTSSDTRSKVKFEHDRRGRTFHNSNSKHKQQPPSDSTLRRRDSGKRKLNSSENQPQNHYPQHSPQFSGNGTKQGNVQRSSPRNPGNNPHPDGTIFRFSEFPELSRASSRDSGRRR